MCGCSAAYEVYQRQGLISSSGNIVNSTHGAMVDVFSSIWEDFPKISMRTDGAGFLVAPPRGAKFLRIYRHVNRAHYDRKVRVSASTYRGDFHMPIGGLSWPYLQKLS